MARTDEYDDLIRELSPRLRDLQPGKAVSLKKIAAGGSLEARRMPTGQALFYWRYTQDKRTERVSIGAYDSASSPKAKAATARGYSIVAAWEAAKALATQNADVPGGLRAHKEREAAANADRQRETAARQKYTLRALCDAYCDWLQAEDKSSHRDARNIFANHLIAAYPALVSKPARSVEKREIVAALRRLTEAGKQTTARKLRAYLRAAYALAGRSDSDASIPETFIHFRIIDNPAQTTAPIKGGKDKNPLRADDLRKYWKALQTEPGVIGAALRLHVVSGGQRAAQLVRLHERDMRRDTLQLLDPKGKRDDARVHLLPITDPIRAQLDLLSPKGYVLSTDGGATPMHATSLSAWASAVGKRAGIEDFQLKRVRSGVETLLAEAGIPLHVRGQLQSHGISGVQAANYDAHEYLPEKRQALDALHSILEMLPDGKVVAMKRRK